MRRSLDDLPDTFVALDFELANKDPRSICAIGVVAVVCGQVAWESKALIRPSRKRVSFARLHGIAWEDLDRQRPFEEVWPQLLPAMQPFNVWVAHNAAFERKVLRAASQEWGLARPRARWVCSMTLAQRRLGTAYRSLAAACRRLNIPLEHHNPLSDARAAAAIVLAFGQSLGQLGARSAQIPRCSQFEPSPGPDIAAENDD